MHASAFLSRGLASRAAALVASAATLFAVPVAAQMPEMLEADPDVPTREGFDTERAILWARPNFVPLRDPDFEPLRGALRSGRVADDTPVLSFDVAGQTLVLVSSQMAYHHVAQGDLAGEPWMVTF